MALPIATATETGNHLPLLGTSRKLLLPMVNLLSPVEPTGHHSALQWLHVPVLLTCHAIRPDQQFVESKRTKPSHSQARELLQLKTPQRISQAKEMQKDHKQSSSVSKN